jgi:hypothetical protein
MFSNKYIRVSYLEVMLLILFVAVLGHHVPMIAYLGIAASMVALELIVHYILKYAVAKNNQVNDHVMACTVGGEGGYYLSYDFSAGENLLTKDKGKAFRVSATHKEEDFCEHYYRVDGLRVMVKPDDNSMKLEKLVKEEV